MKAFIVIEIEDVDTWDQYENSVITEMEEDLKEKLEEVLSGEIGYDKLEVNIK